MLHYTYIACHVARKHTRGKGCQLQIVTEDGIWIPYFEPESKQQLMEWCHITAEKRKFRVVPRVGKSWLQFRWEWWTISTHWSRSAHLCQVRPIRKWKSCSSLTSPGTNVYTHTHTHTDAHKSQHSWWNQTIWTAWPHPPNSPGYAPSDCHTFDSLKEILREHHHGWCGTSKCRMPVAAEEGEQLLPGEYA
jgi:hypothetical protein